MADLHRDPFLFVDQVDRIVASAALFAGSSSAPAKLTTRPDSPTVLVTKDVNLRMKAKAIGLLAQDYTTDHVRDVSKLYDGFQRGLAETGFDGESLGAVSDNMRKNGGFMRVYWSGACYFLTADARLRLQSGGELNLDRALEKLNDCCSDQSLSVPQMVVKLDQLNRVLLFDSLYEQFAIATTVPPFDPIFATMGIDVVDGEVRLQETGPGARLRREIVEGRGSDLEHAL